MVYNDNLPILTFESPIREKYKFLGWFDNIDYNKGTKYYDSKGVPVKEKYDVLENTILYAGWEFEGLYNIKYTVDKSNFILGIDLQTTFSVYKSKIPVEGIYSIEVLNNKNQIIKNNELIGTGSILKIYKNNTLEKNYTNVVLGDTTGGGVVNIADVAKLYRYLRGKINMDDCYKKFGNVVSKDSEIKINDVAKLYRYLREKISSLE